MTLAGLMRHTVNVYRPNYISTTAQAISSYSLVASSVPCFIQPTDSKEEFYYAQRGLENVHMVYTSAVNQEFRRNDVLVFGKRQFHVVGIVNGLEASLYKQLTVCEYPEGAKERLNTEEYV